MTEKYFIVDAHQDLAWNMLCLGRDYRHNLSETRKREKETQVPSWNGTTLIGWDAYQKGRVGVVFSTLFAAPSRAVEADWDTLHYADQEGAHTLYLQQLDAYLRLVEESPEKFCLLRSKEGLRAHLDRWERATEENPAPVGLVALMEAADAVRSPQELEFWWERGLRIIGLAWRGTQYSGGTREPGPLTKVGFELLDGMAEQGFSLDISHMDEEAVLQALDHFEGPIIASHANAKALLKGIESNRFLTDRMIAGLLERDGIIGVIPYNRFLNPEWKKGDPREMVPMDALVTQIDYICQMAGDALHVGIGSDADGGFGLESVPAGMDSIADLQKLAPLLEVKGYTQEDIRGIFGGNWLRFLNMALPENE